MSLTRRATVGAAQLIAGIFAGYIAGSAVIAFITGIFMAALGAAALACAAAITGVGRLLGLRGSFEMALLGAGAGAGLGFAVLMLGLARDNSTLWVLLALIPSLLSMLAYQWSAYKVPPAPTG